MARKRLIETSDEAVEAVVNAESAQTPMERFRAVTRRLANVSRTELEEARQRDEAERAKEGRKP